LPPERELQRSSGMGAAAGSLTSVAVNEVEPALPPPTAVLLKKLEVRTSPGRRSTVPISPADASTALAPEFGLPRERTTTCASVGDGGADGPCGTLIHVLRSVGLTCGEDRGDGGWACNASSTTVSPASLEKSRIGGMPLRAARVPEAWPLASGCLAAIAGPFTLGAERGGGDGGEDGDLLRRLPATGEAARVASMCTSTGAPADDAGTAPVTGGVDSSRGKSQRTTGTCTTAVHPCASQWATLATWMRAGGVWVKVVTGAEEMMEVSAGVDGGAVMALQRRSASRAVVGVAMWLSARERCTWCWISSRRLRARR
jgi:hypothetical protein